MSIIKAQKSPIKSIQRGTATTMNAAEIDITINEVSMDKAMLIVNGYVESSHSTAPPKMRARLTDSTTITVYSGHAGASGVAEWQVVEFN